MAVLKREGSGKKDFALNNQPIALAISLHINNMFATYGRERVKLILKELYGLENQPNSTQKESGSPKEKNLVKSR